MPGTDLPRGKEAKIVGQTFDEPQKERQGTVVAVVFQVRTISGYLLRVISFVVEFLFGFLIVYSVGRGSMGCNILLGMGKAVCGGHSSR